MSKIKKHTDTLVYVVSSNDTSVDGGYEIDIWNDHELNGEPLPEKAIEFMELAKEKNQIYSLKGFMVAHNISEDISMNDYIFFTKHIF